MKRLIQRLRTLVINVCCALLHWTSESIVGPADYPSKRASFGWWLEGQIERVFVLAYVGSDEEIEQAYDIPPKYMSARQRAFVGDSMRDATANCCCCFWTGPYDQAVDNDCPECGESIWLDYFRPYEATCQPLLLLAEHAEAGKGRTS